MVIAYCSQWQFINLLKIKKMKQYTYTGTFISSDNHEYQLSCRCYGFIQAFFLLTANAIKTGNHYQLSQIESEDGNKVGVRDIQLISGLMFI